MKMFDQKATWRLLILFMMCFSIASSCDDDEEPTPTIEEPIASFSFSPDSPNVGDVVTFTNASTNATSFEWNFGDGTTSSEENPTHSYSTDGSYTITLVASGEGGEATATESVTVQAVSNDPEPVANFIYSPSQPEAGEEITFTNTSTNSTSYQWDFGDGTTSTDESPTHTYTTAGDYTVKLTATGSDGTTSDREQSVTVSAIAFGIKFLAMQVNVIDSLGTSNFTTWDEPYVCIFDKPISEISNLGEAVWIAAFSTTGITQGDLPIGFGMDFPDNDLDAYQLNDLGQPLYFFLGYPTQDNRVSIFLYHQVSFEDYAEDRPTEIELRSEEDGVSYTLSVEWVQL